MLFKFNLTGGRMLNYTAMLKLENNINFSSQSPELCYQITWYYNDDGNKKIFFQHILLV